MKYKSFPWFQLKILSGARVFSRYCKMHEWSIAEGIVRSLEAFAEKNSIKRFVAVEINVGELAMLDLDVLNEALKTISQEHERTRNTVFKLRIEHVTFTCNKCGCKWGLQRGLETIKGSEDLMIEDLEGGYDLPLHYMPELVYALMRCPSCGSRDYKVEGGRGVRIISVTFENGGVGEHVS
ncbi:MAG: hydrogenase maturation nickel metallochaperone HypA [Thermoproteales archaeon]|nr:hydrogenase maturation nickel metallochaperone HypA [Thermoproteales archaeon]RLE65453.1 MAG: hypothetical protein DRJ47_05030 [Thermoprotei archaeon]